MPTLMDKELQSYRQMQQLRRPGLSWYLMRFSLKLLELFSKLLWSLRITLVWTVLYWCAYFSENLMFWSTALVLFLVGLIVWSYWNRDILRILPLVGDLGRNHLKKLKQREVTLGRQFLVTAGLMSEDLIEQTKPQVRLLQKSDHWELIVDEPIPGVSNNHLLAKTEEFKDNLDAKRATLKKGSRGKASVIFWISDPLDEPQNRTEPGDLDQDSMKVECAVNEWGKPVSIKFGGAAGMIVSGEPGSGKSAGVTSFLLPLALASNVNLTVIDCKGGDEWSAYEPRAHQFVKGSDDNLDVIEELLEQKVKLMNERLTTMKSDIQSGNFWNAKASVREAGGVNMELIVIDEAQDLFNTDGLDKDEKAQVLRITRSITKLVKKGRSSGMFSMLITQKPTADAIPSTISSNCGVKIAFRLTTPAAETATLGARPEGSPSALDIPIERKGGAVMGVEGDGLKPVRFYYVHEDRQAQLLAL